MLTFTLVAAVSGLIYGIATEERSVIFSDLMQIVVFLMASLAAGFILILLTVAMIALVQKMSGALATTQFAKGFGTFYNNYLCPRIELVSIDDQIKTVRWED